MTAAVTINLGAAVKTSDLVLKVPGFNHEQRTTEFFQSLFPSGKHDTLPMQRKAR
jgi:hypothetical protein